jgi:hypothetical protein
MKILAIGRADALVADASAEASMTDAPVAEAADGTGADATDDGSDASDDASEAATDAPTNGDRRRVTVRDGNVLTDNSTRLRGVIIGIDASPNFPLSQDLFNALSKQDGLNAVHVYLENRMEPPGVNAAVADRIVEMTSQAQMYVIFGIGGGTASGTYDLNEVRSFWSFYAARYRDRTHVLYEIQNQPELTTCGALVQASTIAMENEAYRAIRAAAPDSHVLLLSFGDIPTPDVLADALGRLDGVDWSRASVSIHSGIRCVPLANLASTLDVARRQGIAMLVSEVTQGSPVADLKTIEAASVGWMDFQWLVGDRSPDTFRQQLTAAGVTWCPDYGTWPQRSSACRTQ